MRTMCKLVVMICATLLAGTSFAQSASKTDASSAKAALAKQIIAVSVPMDYVQRMTDSVSSTMTQQLSRMAPSVIEEATEAYIKARNLTDDEKAALNAQKPGLVDDYRKSVLPVFDQSLRDTYAHSDLVKDMIGAMQDWYITTFTETELRQILAFQKTPVAIKLRDSLPQFMSQLMPQLMAKAADQGRAIAEKVASAPQFPDMVSKRLCSEKTPKFCNTPTK